MSLTEYSSLFRPRIEESMQSLIDQAIPAGFDELKRMLTYHMGWDGNGRNSQGKRIRPILLLLCAEACGAKWEAGLPLAAAVELIHNFSLIHDDIQDQSPTRHGRPTVWNRWGIAQAINAGDLMFTLAFHAAGMAAESLPPQKTIEALNVLVRACTKLTQGQFLDLYYEKSETVSLDDYLKMIEGKTAALLSACAELGGIAAGASQKQRDALGGFGLSLGLAFQAVDDWLGIWGDTGKTGKSNQSDLVNHKKTLPVVYSLSHNREFGERWSVNHLQNDELVDLARMMVDDGSQAFTLAYAEKMTSTATSHLNTALPSKNIASQALQELAHLLTNRQA